MLRTPSVRALLPAASRPLDRPASAEPWACKFRLLARTQPDTRPAAVAVSTRAQPPSSALTLTAAPEATEASTWAEPSLSARSSVARDKVAVWACAHKEPALRASRAEHIQRFMGSTPGKTIAAGHSSLAAPARRPGVALR